MASLRKIEMAKSPYEVQENVNLHQVICVSCVLTENSYFLQYLLVAFAILNTAVQLQIRMAVWLELISCSARLLKLLVGSLIK